MHDGCAICRGDHERGTPCIPHWGARTRGMEDAEAKREPDLVAWPPGKYGHADYQLAYWRRRQALLDEANDNVSLASRPTMVNIAKIRTQTGH